MITSKVKHCEESTLVYPRLEEYNGTNMQFIVLKSSEHIGTVVSSVTSHYEIGYWDDNWSDHMLDPDRWSVFEGTVTLGNE